MFRVSGTYICVTGIQENILWLGWIVACIEFELLHRTQPSSPFAHSYTGVKELRGILS